MRHLVENLVADPKQFRGLATRYCKLASRFRAFICMAGWVLATRSRRSLSGVRGF